MEKAGIRRQGPAGFSDGVTLRGLPPCSPKARTERTCRVTLCGRLCGVLSGTSGLCLSVAKSHQKSPGARSPWARACAAPVSRSPVCVV